MKRVLRIAFYGTIALIGIMIAVVILAIPVILKDRTGNVLWALLYIPLLLIPIAVLFGWLIETEMQIKKLK